MEINYDEVEPGVRSIVRALNEVGLVTVGSCEGHPDDISKMRRIYRGPFPGRMWVEIDYTIYKQRIDDIVKLLMSIKTAKTYLWVSVMLTMHLYTYRAYIVCDWDGDQPENEELSKAIRTLKEKN